MRNGCICYVYLLVSIYFIRLNTSLPGSGLRKCQNYWCDRVYSLGLISHPELQLIFFMVFLLVSIISLVVNSGMILLIRLIPQHNSPMFFFLSHLSFAGVWFSSNVTPKMLENLLSEIKTTSYSGWVVQCFFLIALVHVEIFTLAVMAFDW